MENFPHVRFEKGISDRSCRQRSSAFSPVFLITSLRSSPPEKFSISRTRWEAASVADEWVMGFTFCFSSTKACKIMDRPRLFSNSVRMTTRFSLPITFKHLFRKETSIQDILAESSSETRSSQTLVTRLGTSPLQRNNSCFSSSSSRSRAIRDKTAL